MGSSLAPMPAASITERNKGTPCLALGLLIIWLGGPGKCGKGGKSLVFIGAPQPFLAVIDLNCPYVCSPSFLLSFQSPSSCRF